MQLRRLRLENFKRFSELEKGFGEGINVVKGPLNEMGKSTLVEALIVALFENPKSSRKEIEELANWGTHRKPRIELEFESDGKSYLLEKDFEARSARLELTEDGTEWRSPQEVTERLAAILGTDSRALFCATTIIRQDEMARVNSGSREITRHLEGVISGGAEDTAAQVIEKLERKIAEMEKGLRSQAKDPGEIKRLQNEIRQREDKLQEIRDEISKVEEERLKKVAAEERREALIRQIEQVTRLLRENDRLRQIERDIEQAQGIYNERYTSLQRVEEIKNRLTEVNAAMERLGVADEAELGRLEDELVALRQKAADITQDRDKRQRELEDERGRLKRHRLRNLLASTPTLVGGAILTLAGIGAATVNPAWAGLGAVGLALVIGGLWARLSLTREEADMHSLEGRIGEMERAMEELRRREREILAHSGFTNAEEISAKRSTLQGLRKEREELEISLRAHLDGKTPQDIKEECDAAARSLNRAEAGLTPDLEALRLSPQEYVEEKLKLEALEKEREELETAILTSSLTIKNARYDIETLYQKEEELENLKAELRRKEKRVRVLRMALGGLRQARHEVLSEGADPLQQAMDRNLETFTNSRYQRASIDQDSLEVRVYSPEKEDWVSPDQLSGGTRNEIYLACRLALADVILGTRYPPLILDDPFLDFDSVRLEKALEFLSRLSHRQQVIICTKEESYDAIAHQIIPLEG